MPVQTYDLWNSDERLPGIPKWPDETFQTLAMGGKNIDERSIFVQASYQ